MIRERPITIMLNADGTKTANAMDENSVPIMIVNTMNAEIFSGSVRFRVAVVASPALSVGCSGRASAVDLSGSAAGVANVGDIAQEAAP